MSEHDTAPPTGPPTPQETPPAAKRGIGRGLAMVGARSLVGIIGIGIAGASIVAATLIPLPHVGVGPQPMVVSPEASTQQRICPGPVLQFGDNLGLDATTAISVGQVKITSAATSGNPVLEAMEATENAGNTPSQRLVLPPPPSGEVPGILAGSQSQLLAEAELAGFAASECALPESENWLVGGSTTTGRTTLLSLNNPSKVSATVALTIYSETGRVNAVGTDGIVVPPGGRRVFSLAGFAPDIASPVVKVESIGGHVTASLQQSIVRTLTPGGIDVVSAGTAPALMTVIPGIVINSQEDIEAASALGGYSDLAGELRVFVPGDGPSEITVSALSEDGSGTAHSSTFTVQGGMVTDFSLGEFIDGTWTITVASDRPAVAAARTSTVTLGKTIPNSTTSDPGAEPMREVLATDFAWFASASALSDETLVSVAPGPSAMLHLVNMSEKEAVITIDATVGARTTVTVPAGEALAVSVADDNNYRLHDFGTLRASVSYQGDGAIAGFVVTPPHRASQAITVFHQYG